jgi:N6-L-threonylcarbamoyladenine synthase
LKTFQRVLAIETSCDDTSVAVVTEEGRVLSVISAHQNQAHEAFGGIVPEIASRNHTHHLMPLVDEALKRAGVSLADIDGFAVTSKPGLVGSLLVGLVAAKSLSLATGKPFIGVNHLEGHLLAPFLKDNAYTPPSDFAYPYIALAISGGHTSLYRINGLGEYEVLGRTIDDAAGEAFDKFGKMVGLGFPGGVRVDKLGALGNRERFQFPRSFIREDHLNFSFSGMKAAGARAVQNLSEADREELALQAEDVVAASGGASDGASGSGALRPPVTESSLLADLCASFQEAIVDVLIDRLDRAMKLHGLTRAVLTGGVSANSRLRARGEEWAKANGYQLVVPPIRYCTDNAAMIGYAGIERLNRGEVSPQSLGPEPRAPLGSAPLPENLPEWLKKAKS